MNNVILDGLWCTVTSHNCPSMPNLSQCCGLGFKCIPVHLLLKLIPDIWKGYRYTLLIERRYVHISGAMLKTHLLGRVSASDVSQVPLLILCSYWEFMHSHQRYGDWWQSLWCEQRVFSISDLPGDFKVHVIIGAHLERSSLITWELWKWVLSVYSCGEAWP